MFEGDLNRVRGSLILIRRVQANLLGNDEADYKGDNILAMKTRVSFDLLDLSEAEEFLIRIITREEDN